MPTNTLITPSVVKIKEDVADAIYNFNPSDAPLLSMIGRRDIDNVYFEWQRDAYRTPDQTRGAIEGADASYSAQTEPTLLNNRTQIFQDTVSVSNTAERVKKYGRASEIKRLSAKKMLELKRDDEAACIASGATVTGTDAVAPKKRGLFGFLTNDRLGASGGTATSPDPTTNTAPVAASAMEDFDEADLKAGLQSCYEFGGDGAVVLCSPNHKVRISTFTGGVQKVSDVSGKGSVTLNSAIDFYKGDFGVTKIVPNRVMAGSTAGLKSTVYIIDLDKIELAVLRGFEREKMATVGDAENWQIRCETSLWLGDEKPMYAIRDCTDSGA
jgi:hypothetical protein